MTCTGCGDTDFSDFYDVGSWTICGECAQLVHAYAKRHLPEIYPCRSMELVPTSSHALVQAFVQGLRRVLSLGEPAYTYTYTYTQGPPPTVSERGDCLSLPLSQGHDREGGRVYADVYESGGGRT